MYETTLETGRFQIILNEFSFQIKKCLIYYIHTFYFEKVRQTVIKQVRQSVLLVTQLIYSYIIKREREP